MKNKRLNFYLIKYEFLNTRLNGYAFFFGALFPVVLLFLVSISVLKNVPEAFHAEVNASLFTGFSVMVPLATVFLSHASTYANELDKNVPERILLFGYSETQLLFSKLISNIIFFTFCLIFYIVFSIALVSVEFPEAKALITWIAGLYLLACLLLIMAHGIATSIRKFGPTYGVVMFVYFGILIVSGYMGIRVEDLPKKIQSFALLLPTRQLGTDEFIDFWLGGSYNFGPMIQSFLFFGAISALILMLGFYLRKRKN